MTAFPFLYYDSIMSENDTGATIDDGTGDVALPGNITVAGTATFDEMNVSGNVTFSGAVALGSPAQVKGINSQSVELVDTTGGSEAIRGRVVQDSTNNGYVRLETYDSGQNLQGYVEVTGQGSVEVRDASGNGVVFDTTNGSIAVVGAPNVLTVNDELYLDSNTINFKNGTTKLYAESGHLNLSYAGEKLFTFRSDDVANSGDHVVNVRTGDRRYSQTSNVEAAFNELRNSSNGDKVDAAIAALQHTP